MGFSPRANSASTLMALAANSPGPVTVTFTPAPVITGYSLPVVQSTIKRTVTATVSPASKVNDIHFDIAGVDRVDLSVISRDASTGKIILEVKGNGLGGLGPTPVVSPNGDTTILAKDTNDSTVGQVQVVVVVPKTQTHSIVNNPLYFKNECTPNNPVGKTNMWSEGGRLVTIKIFDQFGTLLDSIYDGTNVLHESWVEPKEYIAVPAFVDANMPQALASGVLADPVAIARGFIVPNVLTAQEVGQWKSGNLDINGPGVNTIFAYYGSLGQPVGSAKATQVITCHGHQVTTNYQRIIKGLTIQWIPGQNTPVEQTETAVNP